MTDHTTSKSKTLGQKLIANSLFNLVGQVYVFALAFAATPFVVHRLGPELYGLITLVGTIGGFAGLLNLGIGTALAKYVSELYWKGDLARIRELFQTALGVSLVAGASGCLLLLGFRHDLSTALFHGSVSAERFVMLALLVTALGILLSLTGRPFSAMPMALQRFDLSSLVTVLYATVWYVGGVIVLALGFNVKAVLFVGLGGSVVMLLVNVHIARRLIPALPLRPKLTWSDFRYLFGFSAYVVAGAVSALVVHRLDNVLVAYYLPIASLAFYAIPYSLAEKTWSGISVVTSIILPSASELSSMQAREKLQELYLRASKMVLLAGMPVTIVLLAVPGPILRYWVGPEFAAQGALTMQLLAGGFFINIMAHVPSGVAQGVGHPRISTKYSVLNGVVNLTFFLILIPRFGIVGAGLGFFLSEAIVMPMFIHEVNGLLEVSWLSVILRAYLRPLACGVIAFATLWLCRGYADSLLKLVFVAAVALGLFAALSFAGALDRKERNGIYQEAGHMLRRARGLVSV